MRILLRAMTMPVLLLLLSDLHAQDEILLTNGGLVRGRVVACDAEHVSIQLADHAGQSPQACVSPVVCLDRTRVARIVGRPDLLSTPACERPMPIAPYSPQTGIASRDSRDTPSSSSQSAPHDSLHATPIPAKVRRQLLRLLPGTPATLRCLPNVRRPMGYTGAARYGHLQNDPSLPFIVYRSNPAVRQYDRAVIDLDRDGRLSNDRELRFNRPGRVHEIRFTGGHGRRYRVTLEGHTVQIMPTSWQEGFLPFAGKAVRAALLDVMPDGIFGIGDLLLLDRDGDGSFRIKPPHVPKSEVFPLGELVRIGDTLCQLEFDAQGHGLSITPHAGATGRLALARDICGRNNGVMVSLEIEMRLRNGGAGPRSQVVAPAQAFPMALPTGTYTIRACTLHDGEVASIIDVDSTALQVQGDQTSTIQRARPRHAHRRSSQRRKQEQAEPAAATPAPAPAPEPKAEPPGAHPQWRLMKVRRPPKKTPTPAPVAAPTPAPAQPAPTPTPCPPTGGG